MRRREVIALLGGAAASWSAAVEAQQPGKTYRIGLLANDPDLPHEPAGEAFVAALRESGFAEGNNLIIERRFSRGVDDRFDVLAAELARLDLDVIVTSSNQATVAVAHATRTTPIVMLNVLAPVERGIVASLARPQGNVTGLTIEESTELAAKRLQLLKDVMPATRLVAVLTAPGRQGDDAQWQRLQLAAPSLKVELLRLPVSETSELTGAFARAGQGGAQVLFVESSAFAIANRQAIMEFANKRRLPVVSNFRDLTQIGGLMSYGANRIDLFRRAALYVTKILNGAKPAELPIEQPVKYELVLNLTAAKAFNLELPRGLLLIADEVIE